MNDRHRMLRSVYGSPARYSLVGREDFRSAINTNPHDMAARGAYADWLEEQGTARDHQLRALRTHDGPVHVNENGSVDTHRDLDLATWVNEMIPQGMYPIARIAHPHDPTGNHYILGDPDYPTHVYGPDQHGGGEFDYGQILGHVSSDGSWRWNGEGRYRLPSNNTVTHFVAWPEHPDRVEELTGITPL